MHDEDSSWSGSCFQLSPVGEITQIDPGRGRQAGANVKSRRDTTRFHGARYTYVPGWVEHVHGRMAWMR